MENTKLTYRVDIDGTICQTVGNAYDTSVPISKNIEKINRLYDDGHIIIYWTSRGMTSGSDWFLYTIDQLNKWGCKYNSVQMGKPSFDVMIDDKAKRIEEI